MQRSSGAYGAASPHDARRPESRRSPFGIVRLDPKPEGLGQAPFANFCNQHNLRARPTDRLNPGSHAWRLPSRLRGMVPTPTTPEPDDVAILSKLDLRLAEREWNVSRGFTGQRPNSFRRSASPTAIARDEGFAPTRSSSDTSCRESVEEPVGDSGAAGCLLVTDTPYVPTSRARLRVARNSHHDEPLARDIGPKSPLARDSAAREGRLRRHHPGPRVASRQLPRRS